jgi:hypothetical protein
MRRPSVLLWPRSTRLERSGVGDAAEAPGRDQGVIINDVHHPIRADPKPVIGATVEAFRRKRVLSRPSDSHAGLARRDWIPWSPVCQRDLWEPTLGTNMLRLASAHRDAAELHRR